MREQLQCKLTELREMLEQATCDGTAIDFEDFENAVGTDIGAALNTLEQMVDYYVD
jgi:hypothetical protein